jgi:integrin-linked kinase-associated serine/threonine phosphatase 2C
MVVKFERRFEFDFVHFWTKKLISKEKMIRNSGYESVQGVRWNQEDQHLAVDDLRDWYTEKQVKWGKDKHKRSLYCVFDGHGGKRVGIMLDEWFADSLLEHKDFVEGGNDGDCLSNALVETFSSVDRRVCDVCAARKLDSGSTGVVAVIVDNRLVVANAGDSEAILAGGKIGGKRSKVTVKGSKSGKSKFELSDSLDVELLTQFHNCKSAEESARIESAGGRIVFGRVAGSLQVSRAFGDADLKAPHNGIDKDWVIIEPHISSVELNNSHLFLVIACDGLWDEMSYDEAAAIVEQCIVAGQCPYEAAQALVTVSLRRGSMDNITAVVVYLQ